MIAAEDVARLQQIVGARLGLRLDPSVCRDVLARRAHRAPAGYLDRLARDPSELRVLVAEITVGETYFFRHAEQLAAFAEVALPDRLRATSGPVHVLSAGCSSGEEPYTLAMLARGQPEGAARVVVRGVDVNEAALVHAARGRYSAWSLRALPASLERWFVRRSRDIELSPEIRGAVTFERRNLAEGPAWPPVLYDIVFCRNVLIYFTEEATRDLLARLVAMLAPGGYLFLGHSEILRERSGELALCQSHNTFYYRRVVPVRAAAPVWPEGILASSQRVSAVVDRADRAARGEPAPEVDAWADELARARALFGADRYAEALDQLDRLPAAAAADPDALRMRAIALAERGEVAAASAACHALLGLGAHAASAHHVLSVCRESAGDPVGAAHHVELAVALDAGFAMAHLRCGLLAKRAGDRLAAATALARAIEAFATEDVERIALHGGGLHRDALIQLCRGELAALAGAA